jgi:hypothetical protein
LPDELRRDAIIYARLRGAEREAIEQHARELDVPVGVLVRNVLKQWIKQQKRENAQ